MILLSVMPWQRIPFTRQNSNRVLAVSLPAYLEYQSCYQMGISSCFLPGKLRGLADGPHQMASHQMLNGFLFKLAGWCWKFFLRCSVVAAPSAGLSHIICHHWLVCVNAFDEGTLSWHCNTTFRKESVLHVAQIWIQFFIMMKIMLSGV